VNYVIAAMLGAAWTALCRSQGIDAFSSLAHAAIALLPGVPIAILLGGR